MASIKLSKLIHRAFCDDFVGEAVLTADMDMGTGYRGRGLVNLDRVIPAGTKVRVHIVPAYTHRLPIDRTDPDWMKKQLLNRYTDDAPAVWELETDYMPTLPGENSRPFRKTITAGLYVDFKRQFLAKHPESVSTR